MVYLFVLILCDRRSMGRQKGLTQNRCRGLVCFVFLDYPSLKWVLTRGYYLIILHGSRQRKWKVLKTSRLVIGRNSPAGWLARRANQPVTLQSCDRARPNWLSSKKLLRDSFVASWVWPSWWISSMFRCLDEGRKIAARSWPKLDLVVISPSRTSVDLSDVTFVGGAFMLRLLCDKVGIDGLRP